MTQRQGTVTRDVTAGRDRRLRQPGLRRKTMKTVTSKTVVIEGVVFKEPPSDDDPWMKEAGVPLHARERGFIEYEYESSDRLCGGSIKMTRPFDEARELFEDLTVANGKRRKVRITVELLDLD